MSAITRQADVCIIGAGPVGLALACLLIRGGVTCLVADRTADPATHNRIDPRALALTPAARAILNECDAWSRLEPATIGGFQRMEVWDASGTGRIEFDSASLCLATLGYIVNQSDLESALRTALIDAHSNVIPMADLERVEYAPDRIIAHGADGSQLIARLLVGADGARSRVRELAGIGFASHSYDQHALACTVQSARPHGQVARQRFLTSGPLAFLPLADPHSCGIVWSTTPEQARRLQLQDEATFRVQLAAASGHVLGDIVESGPRMVFPLQRAQAERYCRTRLALVGDAAHCVHPLAGQGANLGLLDAASLAEVLLESTRDGRDPGCLRTLRCYERWRRGENEIMIAALDGMQKLFGSGEPAMQRLRNAGLDLCDALDPVKHWLMARAMGRSGDLPAIALGSAVLR
jgi:2-octaprenylphenol hydroxylase